MFSLVSTCTVLPADVPQDISLDYRNKSRLDDALVRRHEEQLVNSRCRDNGAVGGIADTAQGLNLGGDFAGDGENAKRRVRPQHFEDLPEAGCQFAISGKECDFEKTDRRQAQRFGLPHRGVNRALLFSGQPSGFGEHSYQNMSVQQEVGQRPDSYPLPKPSQRRGVFTMSPAILTLPARIPMGDLKSPFGTRLTTTTGRPRRVTVIVPPVVSTSSIRPRHLALNSVAETTLLVMTWSIIPNWSSGHLHPTMFSPPSTWRVLPVIQ